MPARRCVPIDIVRGMTILSITAFHFYVDTRGGTGPITPTTFMAAFESRGWGGVADTAARTLVGLPSYRLDVLLFVTGFVLMLSEPRRQIDFWRQRARVILPNYWLGTIGATLLLVGLALLRSLMHGTPAAGEISHGTLLARAPYTFEWFDVVRSMSFAGRLETTRTMQVVAPSLWYVILILQMYVAFPLLRWLLGRLGPLAFLTLCMGVMLAARQLVLAGWVWPGFDSASTLVYFLPFRLLGPALGMVAARWAPQLGTPPPAWAAATFALPAMAALLWSIMLGADRLSSVWGPTGALLMGLPALWTLAAGAVYLRRTQAMLTWLGVHALSLLVVQDLLRLVTGTAISLWGRLDPLTWYLLPLYVATAVAATPLWHRVQAAAVSAPRRNPPVYAASTGDHHSRKLPKLLRRQPPRMAASGGGEYAEQAVSEQQ